jgi:hypothetical protein
MYERTDHYHYHTHTMAFAGFSCFSFDRMHGHKPGDLWSTTVQRTLESYLWTLEIKRGLGVGRVEVGWCF